MKGGKGGRGGEIGGRRKGGGKKRGKEIDREKKKADMFSIKKFSRHKGNIKCISSS